MYENKLVIAMTALGFTENESKLYLTLRSNAPMSGYAMAQASGVSRARTYSSLADMIAKGFVLEIPGTPILYEAVDMKDIVASAEKREKTLVDSATNALNALDTSNSRQDGIIQIYGYHENIRYLINRISLAQKSIALLIHQEEYLHVEQFLRNAVERQVHLRLIAATADNPFSPDFASELSFYDATSSVQLQQGNRWIMCTIDNNTGILAIMRDTRQSILTSTTNPQLIRLLNDNLSLYFVSQELSSTYEAPTIWANRNDDIFQLYKSML